MPAMETLTFVSQMLSSLFFSFSCCLQLLAWSEGFGDRIVGDFITIRFASSIWNCPSLPYLLASKVNFRGLTKLKSGHAHDMVNIFIQ